MGCCKTPKMAGSVYEPGGAPWQPNGSSCEENFAEKPCWPASPRGFYGEDTPGVSLEDAPQLDLPVQMNGTSKDGHDHSCPASSYGLRGASASLEDPMAFQHTPSGDSFCTCISQESAMRRQHEQQQKRAVAHSRPHVRFDIQTSMRSEGSSSYPGASPCSVSTADSGNTLSTIASSLAGRPGHEQDSYPSSQPLPAVCSAPAVVFHRDAHTEVEVSVTASTISAAMYSQNPSTGSMGARRSFSSRIMKRLSRRPGGPGHGEEPNRGRRKSLIPGYYKDRQNPNMPGEYSWVVELLEMIVKNETSGVGSLDRSSPHAQATSPLFVVCGACPSSFAPMQAVLYSAVGPGGAIDFWWTKPVKGDPSSLERGSLDRWGKGPLKNDPGRSKAIYKPLGDLFSGHGDKAKQEYCFGLEPVAGTQRAFIEDPRRLPPARYYLYFVWQEEWTSNPFSSDKFIKGKIAYQREPLRGLHASVFLREYCIQNGKMSLADVEEAVPPNTILPNSACKELGALKK